MINWRLSLNKIPSLPSRIEFRRSTPKESASMEGFFGAIASAQRVGTSLHPYLMPIWLDKSVSVWVSINALQIGIWKSMKTWWFHLSVFEILSDSWSVSVAEMGGPSSDHEDERLCCTKPQKTHRCVGIYGGLTPKLPSIHGGCP